MRIWEGKESSGRQWGRGREQRARGREQRARGREQRARGREQRARGGAGVKEKSGKNL